MCLFSSQPVENLQSRGDTRRIRCGKYPQTLSRPAAGLSFMPLIILLIYCASVPTAQVRKLRSRSCICFLHSGNYDGFRSHHAHSSDRYDHNENGGPSSTELFLPRHASTKLCSLTLKFPLTLRC